MECRACINHRSSLATSLAKLRVAASDPGSSGLKLKSSIVFFSSEYEIKYASQNGPTPEATMFNQSNYQSKRSVHQLQLTALQQCADHLTNFLTLH